MLVTLKIKSGQWAVMELAKNFSFWSIQRKRRLIRLDPSLLDDFSIDLLGKNSFFWNTPYSSKSFFNSDFFISLFRFLFRT